MTLAADAPVPAGAGTLVLGVGNILLTDEGVGVHAMSHMQAQYAQLQDVEFLDGGTLSFTLAGPIEECDSLIIFDAAQLKAPPGSVQVFEGEDMDRFLGTGKRSSVHEVSLLDLLAVAKLTDRLPERRALIGIQPEYVSWGEACTPAVQQAIPEACRLAAALIEAWRL